MTVTRLIARPMLASMFVVGGLHALRNAPRLAEQGKEVTDTLVPLVKRVAADRSRSPRTPSRWSGSTPPSRSVRARRWPPAASPGWPRLVLAATLVPTTVAGHQFWNESDPTQKANQRLHFFKNVSMLGGLLLAGVDTEGRPGRGLAGPPCRPRRTPRSPPSEGHRPPRGQAGGRSMGWQGPSPVDRQADTLPG